MQTYKSEIDDSVNFVQDYKNGVVESRYVRRCLDYFICYLSSQTGCNRGCKFCHLTATKQTEFEQVDRKGFLTQAEQVLLHYTLNEPTARMVNFNFMARGEALANDYMLFHSYYLFDSLRQLCEDYEPGLIPRFNISTIMPKTLEERMPLAYIFPKIYPTIYYSLYSMDEGFRNKWMPGAMEPHKALQALKDYQLATDKIIKIHGTFIKDENDSLIDVIKLCEAINSYDLTIDFNIVRYNPPDNCSEESPRLYEIEYELRKYLKGKVKIVERVGYDVNASCGMFV